MTPPRSKPGGGGDSADESLASPVVMATPCSIRGTEEVVPATPEEPPMAEAVPTKRVTMQMRHPPKPLHDPNDPGTLVLCTAAEAEALSGDGSPGVAVVVDPYIAGKLRPHQREGVRWMYRVLHGLEPDAGPHTGCLLADDMGLGKSLQSIALVWTMLKQGPRGVPTAKRVLLVCPASLVGAWGAEFNKWIGVPCASRAGRRWRGGRSGCLREMEARDATGHGERLRLLARPGDVLRDLAPTLANRRKSRARPSDL